MRYSRTPFDDTWDEMVRRMIKKCCALNPKGTYSQYKTMSWWHKGIILDIVFKKWKASINAPTAAVFIRTDTGEEIDLNDYFHSDKQMFDAFDKGLIDIKKSNWYQYWIFDDKGTFIGGDRLSNNEITTLILTEGDEICDKLREAYFNAHPEEVARKKAKIKWEYDLPEVKVIKSPELIAEEKAEAEVRRRKRAEAKARKAAAPSREQLRAEGIARLNAYLEEREKMSNDTKITLEMFLGKHRYEKMFGKQECTK